MNNSTASLMGLMVLENGRALPGSPLGRVFDCHFFVGPNPDDELFGLVRVFGTSDLDLNHDICMYNGLLKVAKMLPEVNCYGDVGNPLVYHFVADKVWVSALSPLGIFIQLTRT
jgi:hypothetical protein